MADHTQVAIVGGGITGLALGFELRRLGVSHRILEANSRPGGVIRSGEIEGHLLEWGPQRTRLTRGISELIDELGIADEVITAPRDLPLFVYRDGRLRRVPFSAADFFRSDIVPLASKARLALEPFTRGADPSETVASYFARKVGPALYENLVGPLYGGLYASDPADMIVGLSLGHVLREFGIRRSLLLPLLRRGGSIDPPVACSFRRGLATLPRALAEANRENVTYQKRVTSLVPRGGGWEVRFDEGALAARHVVITTPAGAAADLLETPDPVAAAALRRLVYNGLAVVHLYAETGLRGLGYQVSFAETLATRGVTFNDSLFGRTGVYTAYLGGAKSPHVVTMSDPELAALATREFELVTGARASVLSIEREWMPAWDRSWASIQGLRPAEGIRFAANWEARPGIPGRLAQARRLAQELASADETVS